MPTVHYVRLAGATDLFRFGHKAESTPLYFYPRHYEVDEVTWFAFTPCLRATLAIEAPSSSISSNQPSLLRR